MGAGMKKLPARFPLYSHLLRLYPSAYRQRYGQEILQITADMLDDAPNALAKMVIWVHLAIDLPINVARQQLIYTGNIMGNHMPGYIKWNGLISLGLLLPFMLALVASGFDSTTNNRILYSSWLRSHGVQRVWVLWMPTLALVIAAITYLSYALQNHGQKNWLKRILDVRLLWPVVIPIVIAAGIMFILIFHDSVRCWAQSPSYVVRHIQQVWQCSEQRRAFNSWLIIKRAFF